MVNHHPGAHALNTKEGLCQSLKNSSCFEQVDLNSFFPRCYRLGIVEEQEDFRLTAARSLLKLALEKVEDRAVETEQSPKSEKGPGENKQMGRLEELVEDALKVCEQHLGVLGHQDIDRKTPSPCRTCIAWDRFLHEYYRVGARLALSGEQRKQCQHLLERLGEQLPQLAIEGTLNVWILKPSAKSRGRGIVCATRLEKVLELARSYTDPSVGLCEWVVQKYVEQPLTIFDTKFDIRQWFVVTDWNPLTAWFYRDSYLRFCSRPFSLRKAVQGGGDHGHPALHSAPVSSRKGCFELFGADFLIAEDCQPWLLEINSCPTMSPCSAVTRRLCANVQRDTLRLVLDRKDDPTCSIGAFELLYKEVERRSTGRRSGCSVGSRGLPQLTEPGRQIPAARSYSVLPAISPRPPVRGTVPPLRRAPSSLWRSPGYASAPARLSDRPARLPAL
uniref:Tubulin monoglycylase TTLL3 n=1 Tax=Malurus cyaneus samueli TaxID=2593467 RepID=A0A8C5T3C7_9PASS